MTVNRIHSLVFREGNKIVTDSLTVANVFEKSHDNVIRDIRSQIEKLNGAGESEWVSINFEECDYTNDSAVGINQNRRYPKFNMTEDGFVIIAMAYTTVDAMRMKVRFIEEFRLIRDQSYSRVPTILIPDIEFSNFDQVTKLLQMLRMGLRDKLFTDATDRALRLQIAELVLGQPVEAPNILKDHQESSLGENLDLAAQTYAGEWYLSTNIARLAGVSVNMIGKLATKHNMRIPKYSVERKVDPKKRTSLSQILYNEAGKNEFLRIVKRMKRGQ